VDIVKGYEEVGIVVTKPIAQYISKRVESIIDPNKEYSIDHAYSGCRLLGACKVDKKTGYHIEARYMPMDPKTVKTIPSKISLEMVKKFMPFAFDFYYLKSKEWIPHCD